MRRDTRGSGSRDLVELFEPRRLLNGVTFTPASDYVAGAMPVSVVTGDFDGNGTLDLATANAGDANVSVLLGNGDGTFTNNATYPTGHASNPTCVVTGDFDGNGTPDLAVTNFDGHTVSVLLGHGDGTFAAAANVSLPSTSRPKAVVTGDFDGNGKLDLAVASQGSNTVTILYNNGSGAFTVGSAVPLGYAPSGIVAGDFDGNGKIDLATANAADNTVSILLGNGSGAFAVSSRAVGGGPTAVWAGDFDNNGATDLAVADTNNNTVSVLLGSGDGTFGYIANYACGVQPNAIIGGDFDNDGRTDLATANVASNSVSVLTGYGDGTFVSLPTNVPVGLRAYSVASGDLNGDGEADLVTVDANSPGTAAVLLNTSPGEFTPGLATAVGNGATDLTTADFNGDGRADVAVATHSTGGTVVNAISVLISSGKGTYATAAVTTTTTPLFITSGDFNGDGRADLAYDSGATSTIDVLLGNGNGTFGSAIGVPVGFVARALKTADLNGDGRDDLITINQATNGAVSVALSTGNGTFGAAATYAVGTDPVGLVAADLDGDGFPDLATVDSPTGATATGSVSVLLNNGAGGFGSESEHAVGSRPTSIVAGDFNNDGHIDLAVTNTYYDNTISLLFGNGAGFFTTSILPTVVPLPIDLVAADLNGDGNLDLAYLSNQYYANSVRKIYTFEGNGHGKFTPSYVASSGSANFLSPLAAADVTGDTKPDLVALDGTANKVYTLINQANYNPYVKLSGDTVIITGNATPMTIGFDSGRYVVSYAGGTASYAASLVGTVRFDGAAAVVVSDLGAISVNTANSAAVTFATAQHLTALTVGNTTSVTTAPGGGNLLRVQRLSLGSTAKLDLNDNDLIYDYTGPTPLATVRTLINAARNKGAWTGFGLTSSAAKNNPAATTTLGYTEAGDYKSIYGNDAAFDGETIDGTTVLVKYTLYGDADFNRKVDFNDFLRLQNGYGTVSGATFATGDFTYDGKTDFNDFLALQNNYNVTLSDKPASATRRRR